ncbi:MAG TPA: AI-2E family transporter [Tepidisphaeraceae bacterium]|nr:AI-2E family transporter [Tepidisphaeraceae bacterium]
MARSYLPGRPSRMLVLAGVAVVIAALYFAQDFLIPLALSLLLSFLLAPLCSRLERWKLGRVVSVIIVVVFSLGLLAGVGWVVTGQVIDLANKLPSYRNNIHSKVMYWRASTGNFNQQTQVLQDSFKDLTAPNLTSRPTTHDVEAAARSPEKPLTPPVAQAVQNLSGSPTTQPIQVEVKERDPTPIQFMKDHVAPYVSPLATAAMVIVFVVFILLQRDDLRDRMIRLVSQGQINLTTQAMDDAATRISRYLLMQLVVNVTYGIPIGIGLWFIGVPNAILWGLMATLLRFIPYIGPWIAASVPILLSIAAFPDSQHFFMTVGLYVVVELISNNVIEPWLYGASTGLSATAVVVSAVFWTWLWGPLGLLMSTPLTVCLVVMGKYVPQLQFLDILLGDEPVLEPHVKIYQRLLAMDQEEATDLVEEYLKEKNLIEVYDQVLIPALGLAEHDRHRGLLDEQRQKYIRQSMKELVEDLGERYRLADAEAEHASEATQHRNGNGNGDDDRKTAPCALCLPARDEADEIVAMMLSQVLEQLGCVAKYIPVAALASEMVQTVEKYDARLVCISALPPSAVAHARYLCKRVRARKKDIPVLVGLWGTKVDSKKAMARLACSENDKVVRTLADARAEIAPMVAVPAAEPETKQRETEIESLNH